MRISGLNITQKGLLMVLIPVVFQLLFIAALNIPMQRFAHELESMRIGKKILFAIQENEIDLSKMIWALMVGGPQESIAYMASYHEKVVKQHKWSMQNQTSDPELLQLAKEGSSAGSNPGSGAISLTQIDSPLCIASQPSRSASTSDVPKRSRNTMLPPCFGSTESLSTLTPPNVIA